MPKTYGTVSTFTAGSVLTAAQLNVAGGAVNNLVVPASCQVVRTTDVNPYTSNTDISWTTTAAWDTDGMFSAGSPTVITIQTAGLYVVTFTGQMTGTATMTRYLAAIYKSGSGIAYQDSYGSSTESIFSVSVVTSCAAAATLTARVSVTGGSAYIIKGNASESYAQTRLTATWIGRTS